MSTWERLSKGQWQIVEMTAHLFTLRAAFMKICVDNNVSSRYINREAGTAVVNDETVVVNMLSAIHFPGGNMIDYENGRTGHPTLGLTK